VRIAVASTGTRVHHRDERTSVTIDPSEEASNC
jgi:hypothetical protein